MRVKPISIAESVYEHIREKIIYGEYPAGTFFSEGELAAELNVSKTPVREAFNGLKHEGLLQVIPYKGYIVAQLSLNELHDLFELRIILEIAAVELAIQRITAAQLEQFKQLALKRFSIDSEEARKKFMKVNINFHSYLGEVSGNKQLAAQLKNIIQKLQRGLYIALKESRLVQVEEEYVQLVEAIEQKNESMAKALIIKHIEDSKQNIWNMNGFL